VLFARTTGMIIAPESAHALAAAVEAVQESPAPICVLANVSGHGLLDLSSYDAYLNGEMDDGIPDEENLVRSLTLLRQRNEQVQVEVA